MSDMMRYSIYIYSSGCVERCNRLAPLRLNACIALLYIVLYCNANAIYQWGTLRRALSVGSSLGGGASTMIDDRLCAVRGT